LLGAHRTLILEDGRLDGALHPRAADIRDLTVHRQARRG
jgi:hypothetical protein